MSARFPIRKLRLACAAQALALLAGIPSAFAAEQVSARDIIKALKPPELTRGLATSPDDAARAAEEARFIDSLRNRPTRSPSSQPSSHERKKVASIATAKPSSGRLAGGNRRAPAAGATDK